MKRVYISGKITGTDDYIERFDEAEQKLLAAGYTSIVNPAAIATMLPKDFSHDDYMRVSITELSCCEAIYLTKGWEDSKGAKQELLFALANGIEIITE